MLEKAEERLRSFVSLYQQKVFALVLYLIGGDRDKAYDICAASFAQAMRAGSFRERDEVFFARVIRMAIENARETKAIPVFSEFDSLDLPAAEKGPLLIVAKALQGLDFQAKALVLLRDQLNLSFGDMAAIMRFPEGRIRTKTVQARMRLREKVEEILNHE